MISVIVPLYNEGKVVFSLINHLKNLDGMGEAILVDASDHSDSIAAIEQLSKAELNNVTIKFVRAKGIGRGLQMNHGAELSQGNVLLFLHCDTRLPDDAMDLIDKTISVDHAWGRFDVALDANNLTIQIVEKMINLRSRFRTIATGDQAMFCKKSLFEKCGKFPEIPIMEDIAISKKFNQHTPPALINTAVTTSARRWNNSGVIRTVLLMWKLRFMYWIGVDSYRLAKLYGNVR